MLAIRSFLSDIWLRFHLQDPSEFAASEQLDRHASGWKTELIFSCEDFLHSLTPLTYSIKRRSMRLSFF